MVYNLHHGHDHLDRFAALLAKMKPYLMALNLNGMDPGGDRVGRKILPLGQGSLDLELLADHPRQRLSRADRHPRPHRWTTPRSGSATTSTASTGSSRSSTGKPAGPDPSPARPCRPARRAKTASARQSSQAGCSVDPAWSPLIAEPRRGLRARGRGLRLAEVRLPLLSPRRRPRRLGRARPHDRRGLPEARGDGRIGPLAQAARSRTDTRRSRSPQPTARSARATK